MTGIRNISRPTIGVLGGGGNIGKRLCRLLSTNGFDVFALGRKPTQMEGLQYIEFDLLKAPPSRLPKFDVFVHLAWFMTHGEFWYSEQNERYYHASRRLIHFLAENGVGTIAVAGTCAELGTSQSKLDLKSLSGAKAELLNDLKKIQAIHGIDYHWFRIFYAFGEGENSHKLLSSLKSGVLKKSQLNNPNSRNDFIDFDTIAELMYFSMEEKIFGELDLGSGTCFSVGNLCEHIEKGADIIQQEKQSDCDLVADMKWIERAGRSLTKHKFDCFSAIKNYLLVKKLP